MACFGKEDGFTSKGVLHGANFTQLLGETSSQKQELGLFIMGFEARPPPSFGQVGCTCGSRLFSKNN